MVILVLIDGLRPDALEQAKAPNLKAFRGRSAYTMHASSLMPTITLPCHMGIFYSVAAERHGILTNTFTPLARPLPSLVDVVKAAGKRAAFFTSWDGFSALHQPGNLDYEFMLNYTDQSGAFRLDVDAAIAEAAVREIPRHQFDFSFVYFGSTDSAGHQSGWMAEGYMRQIEFVDQQFGRLLEVLPGEAHVLVQADHGGHDRTHGTNMPEDVLIPWMLGGPLIKYGHEIQNPITLLHTAPTLAKLLEIEPAAQWEGTAPADIWVK